MFTPELMVSRLRHFILGLTLAIVWGGRGIVDVLWGGRSDWVILSKLPLCALYIITKRMLSNIY